MKCGESLANQFNQAVTWLNTLCKMGLNPVKLNTNYESVKSLSKVAAPIT